MNWNRHQLAETLALFGVAGLIAGYLRFSIQKEMMLTAEILLIVGGVLLLTSIALGFDAILKFFSKRSSQMGTNTAVMALAVVAILVILNFLSFQHHKRFDLTTEKLYTLSPQTKKIVDGLKEDVNVVHFSKQPNQQLDDLLAEYHQLSGRVKYQEVDPDQRPDMAKEYGVSQMGQVVVAFGSHHQDVTPPPDGAITEQDITSAIVKVTSDKMRTVCFVTGHGEKSLADSGPHGYSDVDLDLKHENYTTDSINLVQSNSVPSNCDVVVIPGPTQSYFPQEVAMLSKYLDAGGKALIEVDPITADKQAESGLDSLFKDWNINVGNNIVIDASGMGRLLGAGPAIPLVVNYGDSPITKGLERTMSFYPLARTVSIADKQKLEPQDVELLMTSAQSFTTPKIENNEVRYDPKKDQMGPLSLGVAGDKKVGDATARLVVIGDSDFASNEAVGQQSNGDVFVNTIDWLSQNENLISIRPKSSTNRSVSMTDSQAITLRWIDLFCLPGIVIIVGIGIWWKRR